MCCIPTTSGRSRIMVALVDGPAQTEFYNEPDAGGGIAGPGDIDGIHRELRAGKGDHSISRISRRDCLNKSCLCRRSSMASRVYNPCFDAFLLPRGAPVPGAPPCI